MSTTKLTLKLDNLVIQRTKRYAQQHHMRLSGMVENYFRALVADRRATRFFTPLVRELSGVASAKSGREWKRGYAGYLIRKYLRE